MKTNLRKNELGEWWTLESNDGKIMVGMRNPTNEELKKEMDGIIMYEFNELIKKQKEEATKNLFIRIGLDILTLGGYEGYLAGKEIANKIIEKIGG